MQRGSSRKRTAGLHSPPAVAPLLRRRLGPDAEHAANILPRQTERRGACRLRKQGHVPDLGEAVDSIIAHCKAAGVAVGMHVFFTGVDGAAKWFQRGMNFISYRDDTLFVAEALRHELGQLRKVLEP